MRDTNLGAAADISDGGDGTHWAPSSDLGGPHAPFDMSNETESGLDCLLIVETEASRPPTAQAHFFAAGSEVEVRRGGLVIGPDPLLLEIDLDFDCFHRSNPLCNDFEARYRASYGDFVCEWTPSACTALTDGCYRDVGG
jgi:hypothetical protein